MDASKPMLRPVIRPALPQAQTSTARKPKMLVYLGNKGDQGAPFEMAGCKFEKGVVTPVSDDVYTYFRNVHRFWEIYSVTSGVPIDFPKRF